MRIISGKLKGRKIPFVNSKYDNADVTSEKVKEALFSVLSNTGAGLNGASFLDLYGGCGQIGFEACSRGAEVVINERDKRRFLFIQGLRESFGNEEGLRLYNYSDKVCMRYLMKKEFSFDYLFLDPPYVKKKGSIAYYGMLMASLAEMSLIKDGGIVVLQYYKKNILSEIPAAFQLLQMKEYGSTSLSYYSFMT